MKLSAPLAVAALAFGVWACHVVPVAGSTSAAGVHTVLANVPPQLSDVAAMRAAAKAAPAGAVKMGSACHTLI